MFAGDDHDALSLHSAVESDRASLLSERRPSDIPLPRNVSNAESVLSSRSSILSDREADYGWSGNSGAFRNARLHRDTTQKRTADTEPVPGTSRPHEPPVVHPAIHREAYRPPFAPSAKFDLHEEDEGEAELVPMPVLNRKQSDEPKRVPDLQRGKSLKDKFMSVIKPKSPDAERDDPLAAMGNAARGLSRRITRSRARDAERLYDADADRLGHFSSRLADYDDAAVQSLPPEIAQIPLYRAPASAHVPDDAPALSSYAPRAPLRPRSQTLGADTPIIPATTVGQAARAYSIKRAQTMAARTDADGAKSRAPVRYNADERESRRSMRKAKVVPEGWATANQLKEKDETEDLLDGK